jgi:hypothetical protein
LKDQVGACFFMVTALDVFFLETVSLGTLIFNDGNGIRKIYRNQATNISEKSTIIALVAETEPPKSSSKTKRIGQEIYHQNCSY